MNKMDMLAFVSKLAFAAAIIFLLIAIFTPQIVAILIGSGSGCADMTTCNVDFSSFFRPACPSDMVTSVLCCISAPLCTVIKTLAVVLFVVSFLIAIGTEFWRKITY